MALSLNRLSYLAKVPYALRHRDGSSFADAPMMLWNMASAGLWVYVASIGGGGQLRGSWEPVLAAMVTKFRSRSATH